MPSNAMHDGRSVTGTAGWTELIGTHFVPGEFQSKDERFPARLAAADLGPLHLVRLGCARVGFERGQALIDRSRQRDYLLILALSGSLEFRHFGRTGTLAAGDLLLCDSAAPLKILWKDDAETLAVRIPAAALRERLPSPESFCARPLQADEGLTSTAATMAVSLFDRLEAGLALHCKERVWRHLIDMMATALIVGCDLPVQGSSVVSSRRATVKLYIEQHLRDPDLSPSVVAAQLKLSSRYLRMIFTQGNETVSAYILRRRLEECARQIADPSWRGHSMTEIAFGWGFNSAPHFTRSFRERYGMSPREYRRLKLEEGGGAFARRATEASRRPASPPAHALHAAAERLPVYAAE